MQNAAKHAEFEALLANAHKAGSEAAQAADPAPMTVVDLSSSHTWHAANGACGSAWVAVHPATSAFARWAVKNGHATRSAYNGGVRMHIRGLGQSVDRKSAAALAMADVLRSAGLKAYADSRLD